MRVARSMEGLRPRATALRSGLRASRRSTSNAAIPGRTCARSTTVRSAAATVLAFPIATASAALGMTSARTVLAISAVWRLARGAEVSGKRWDVLECHSEVFAHSRWQWIAAKDARIGSEVMRFAPHAKAWSAPPAFNRRASSTPIWTPHCSLHRLDEAARAFSTLIDSPPVLVPSLCCRSQSTASVRRTLVVFPSAMFVA